MFFRTISTERQFSSFLWWWSSFLDFVIQRSSQLLCLRFGCNKISTRHNVSI
jgi:hypothetical protein